MKLSKIKAIRILSDAQKEDVLTQKTHLSEITDALFEVFKNCTEEQFTNLSDGIVVSAGILYKIGHYKGGKNGRNNRKM